MAPAQSAILAHYSFDSDFTDGSGNGNDLTTSSGTPNITSSAGETAFGGGALNLDQSGTQEHLQIGSSFSFNGTTPWSVAWWGQRSSSSLGSQGMIAGTIANSSDFIWTPDNPSVVQGIRVRHTTSDQVDSGGIIDDNAFHHWAVSYDGLGNLTIWRDNASLGTSGFSGNLDMTHVGAGTATINNSFFGQIDELYIFDEAIDGATVDSLFTSNTVVPEPGSLALLAFGGLALIRRRR